MSGGTRAPTRASARRPLPRQRAWVPWILAALLAAAVAALAVVLLTDDDGERANAANQAAPTTKPAVEPAGRIIGFPLRVNDAPSALGVGAENVWVLHEGSGTIVRVDPTRHRTVGAPVPIGGRPRAMSIGFGALWVTSFDGRTVTKVRADDPSEQIRIPVGASPWGIITSSPTSVWVVNHDDDTLLRVDTRTGTVVGGPIVVGEAPVNVAVGSGSVWVTNSMGDSVSRVDPRSRTVVATIRVGDHPEGLTVGAGSVWVANLEDDTVSRIDPAKNRVVATIRVGDRPLHLKATESGIWVPHSGDGTVGRIDPDSNAMVGAPVQIARTVERIGEGFDAIWVTSASEDTLTRVEPTPP